MAYTGYFETEKNVGAKWNGWLWLVTYINTNTFRITRKLANGSQHFTRTWIPLNIYCHQDAAPEPVTDGHILTSIFDDAVTEYSGSEGYIHSFTSSTGFFSRNQDFSLHPAWTVYWNAKNTGVIAPAVGHFEVEVYKRNAIDEDTKLFSGVSLDVMDAYSSSGYTMSLPSPTGTVTTADRLRIRVKMYEAVPI